MPSKTDRERKEYVSDFMIISKAAARPLPHAGHENNIQFDRLLEHRGASHGGSAKRAARVGLCSSNISKKEI